MTRTGFIGIGNMGLPIALRLVEAGHRVIAYDSNAGHHAGLDRWASSATEIAQEAEIVFLSLPTPAIVAAVAEEVAGAGGRTRIVVDLSTTGPDGSRAMAAMLAKKGIVLVDCPVSGGVAGAKAGTLALMVGAPADTLDEVRPLLEPMGRLFHVGTEAGMGQMMKIINNIMSASALTVAGEGVSMATKAGLDPDTVVQVLNAGSGRNSATLDKFPRQVLPGTFDAGFALGLMLKDVRLCIDQARALGLTLPAFETIATQWAAAAEALGEDADFTRVVELAERAAGVRIRSRQPEPVAHG